ncbi:MAG: DUF2505 family protein [Nannocystis sp.]|nr:DUF2505 family protein [Nannocystis sp.]MBA3548605.1 DUF2505 family protein [Nannocystis sp.]
MKFSLRHPYMIEPEAFWRDVFFDPAYNEALYREGLHFEAFKVLEESNPPDGRRTRKLAVKPKLDAPGPIKKILGDSIDYIEDGRLDISRPAWITKVIPSKLADKVNIHNEFWLERTGPGRSDRVASFDIEVKIFGLGGIFEKFLEKTMRESYQQAADFTNLWLERKGLAGK